VVTGRYALWEETRPGKVIGLPPHKRATLVTHVLDAVPDHQMTLPEPTLWPLAAAIATSILFIGSIFTAAAVIWGMIPVFITMVCWFWPKKGSE
jgi:cytochrome c oxidase subunit 1